ncbi:MAG: phosphoribosylamine--glycine ligase [Chloroflexi bacterium]|nr:phosphoribosylamine--glycine ligase [Chloroflexota bacterium]
MNVLIIGSGAREHAIAWKLRQSPTVDRLYVAPGNAGIAAVAELRPLSVPRAYAPPADVQVFFDAVHDLVRACRAEFVVIGPDDPLALGLADAIHALGVPVFGPTRAAAKIEASKSFAKDLMRRYGIPMAESAQFDSFDAAADYVVRRSERVVVKADGLAVGKGAIVTEDARDAVRVLQALMVERSLGQAGATVVIEDFLQGRETSAHAFSDGRTVAHMPFACDHKPVFDGGRGPNTGGMGAYSPVAWLSDAAAAVIQSEVTERAVAAMAAEGAPFAGVLFPGLMITSKGPKVLEFNARFGDPEAEVLLPRLEADLLAIMRGCVFGTLSDVDVRWRDEAAVTVMLASGGYPGAYQTGFPIDGLQDVDDDVLLFHAGTRRDEDGRIVTSGGRVLTVTALGTSVEDARDRAYANVRRISFEGMHYRTDIGAMAAGVGA